MDGVLNPLELAIRIHGLGFDLLADIAFDLCGNVVIAGCIVSFFLSDTNLGLAERNVTCSTPRHRYAG